MAVDLEKVKEFVQGCRIEEVGRYGFVQWPLSEALCRLESIVAEVEGLRAAAEVKEKAFQRLSGQYARLLGQLADDVGGTR